MDGTAWITVSTIVSALAAVVSAVATIVIVWLTNKTIKTYDKQLRIAKAQVDVTQSQTFNQARPILLAPENISGILQSSGNVQWQKNPAIIGGLQNIGTGPAFNIYGIFFGKPFQDTPPRERYIIWNYGVLPPSVLGKEITLSQGSSLRSETTIGGHTLYVPDDPQHNGCSARLTLTYHDIFGRKFASIYDYQNVLGWICVEHIEGIEQDLHELNEQEPMAQTAKRTYYNMGKQMQP